MKIKYQFVNEVMDIEVEERWGHLLIELDRLEYNNNQTETRRHASLNGMDYEGDYFIDPAIDIEGDTERALDVKKLQRALELLLPQQKELLRKVYFEGWSIVNVAREEGVGESAVRDRLKRIIEKMKKVLK